MFLLYSWISLRLSNNRLSYQEPYNSVLRMKDGLLVQNLPGILEYRLSDDSILSSNFPSFGAETFSPSSARLICSILSLALSLSDSKLSQIELQSRSNQKINLSYTFLFKFLPQSLAMIVFQRLWVDSHRSLYTFPSVCITFYFTSTRLKPRLTNFAFILLMRPIILPTDSLSHLSSPFIIYKTIQSKNVQYLIILSRKGDQRFHEYLPIILPKVKKSFLNEGPTAHLAEFRAIKAHFLISEKWKNHMNTPTPFKIIYFQPSKPSNNYPFINQMADYIRYGIRYHGESYIIHSRDKESQEFIKYQLQSLLDEEFQSLKLMNSDEILKEKLQRQVVLFPQSFNIEQLKSVEKVVQHIKKANCRAQFFKFPWYEGSLTFYPQLIDISFYNQQRQKRKPLPEKSVDTISKKKIIVYYDFEENEEGVDLLDDDQPVQLDNTNNFNYKNNLFTPEMQIFICEKANENVQDQRCHHPTEAIVQKEMTVDCNKEENKAQLTDHSEKPRSKPSKYKTKQKPVFKVNLSPFLSYFP